MKKRIVFFLTISIFIFSGCSFNKDNNISINNKVEEEINYMQNEIFSIVNKYVKDEYYENNSDLNWDSINKDAQKLSSSIDTIIIDFSEIKITNDDLINMRNNVNNILISIGNKNDKELLDACAYLYSSLPNILEKIDNDQNKINIMRFKSYILLSYVQCNSLAWEDAKDTIIIAESKYNDMSNNIDYMQEYSYNLNRIYVLLEEFRNAIELEELELVKNKYINFIENL